MVRTNSEIFFQDGHCQAHLPLTVTAIVSEGGYGQVQSLSSIQYPMCTKPIHAKNQYNRVRSHESYCLIWANDDYIWIKTSTIYTSTGCPKKKLALGKHLNIATHGFKMCILYFKKDKLGPNPSRPLKGHPWRHTISLEPIWTPKVLLGVRSTHNCQIS